MSYRLEDLEDVLAFFGYAVKASLHDSEGYPSRTMLHLRQVDDTCEIPKELKPPLNMPERMIVIAWPPEESEWLQQWVGKAHELIGEPFQVPDKEE